MRDLISEHRCEVLHPKARGIFKSFIEDAETGLDITLRVTQGLRTFEEQSLIYAQGRTLPGPIVTNAKPGYSFHNWGLAIDVCPLVKGKLDWSFDFVKLKLYSDKYLIKWGGTFKSIMDKPHFELSFNYTIKQLFQKYQRKEYIPGTKYLNI